MRTYIVPLAGENWNSSGNASSFSSVDLRAANTWTFYRDVLACFALSVLVVSRTRLIKLKNKMLSLLFTTACTMLGLIMAPVFFGLLAVLWTFREVARFVLLQVNSDDSSVVDLMQGTDMFWAMDDHVSRSVINVLALVDFGSVKSEDMEPLKTVKELMKRVIQGNQVRYWKLSCFKKLSSFGYYYWERQEGMRVEDHVKWMPIEEERMTVENLNEFVGSVVNRAMPNNDQSLWEILVGRSPLLDGRAGTYPVVFRVHHSVGDGPSLITLLVESLAKESAAQSHVLPKFQNLLQEGASKQPKLLLVGKHDRKDLGSYLFAEIATFFQKLFVLTFATESMVRQALLACDDNDLHGKDLSGAKRTAFFMEKETKEPRDLLMSKIKRIRDKTGCHFSDVLFTAVSDSLEGHYRNCSAVPRDVAVIIPTRLPDEDRKKALVFETEFVTRLTSTKITKIVKFKNEGILNNRFSVGLLHLPVASETEKSNPLEKLERVRERTGSLRNSFDHSVNHWLLNNMLSCLPVHLMRKAMGSLNCTLAVSNLPGPRTHERLGAYRIEDIVFWVPNKEMTGIGLTVLSYAGKLNLGLIADSALIPDKEDLKAILDRIVISIHRMEEVCV